MVSHTRNSLEVYTGSVVTISGLGSAITSSIFGTVSLFSMQVPNNTGSTYIMGISDTEGYEIIGSRSRQGAYSILTGFPVSGVTVVTVTGAQVNGTYNFRYFII